MNLKACYGMILDIVYKHELHNNMYGFRNGARGHGICGWFVWWSGGYDEIHKVHVGIVGEY